MIVSISNTIVLYPFASVLVVSLDMVQGRDEGEEGVREKSRGRKERKEAEGNMEEEGGGVREKSRDRKGRKEADGDMEEEGGGVRKESRDRKGRKEAEGEHGGTKGS